MIKACFINAALKGRGFHRLRKNSRFHRFWVAQRFSAAVGIAFSLAALARGRGWRRARPDFVNLPGNYSLSSRNLRARRAPRILVSFEALHVTSSDNHLLPATSLLPRSVCSIEGPSGEANEASISGRPVVTFWPGDGPSHVSRQRCTNRCLRRGRPKAVRRR